MKDIKTKESIRSVKEKDNKKNLKHFIKDVSIHQKEKVENKNSDKGETSLDYAPNRVEQAQKVVARKSYQQGKMLAKKKQNNKRILKQKDLFHEKSIIKEQNIKERSFKLKCFVSKGKNVNSKPRLFHVQKSDVRNVVKNKHSYTNRMKSLTLDKHKSKIKIAKLNNKYTVRSGTHLLNTGKKGILFTKFVAHSLSNLWSYGMCLILLVVISLFIGVFACLSDDGGVNSEIQPLSAEVIAYEDTIVKYAKQYEIIDYVPIIQAIMMQESGGKGTDPMQSSESGFNMKYPRVPNSITEPEYSIEVGVQTFSDCLKRSSVSGPQDTERLYLALQGYNYGSGYIEWALNHFGGYSKANAKLFSDNKKTELGTDVYGDPYYVSHVMRYVGLTFRGGTNPNFNNYDAWVNKNPYSHAKLYGQCTWFAWGRFYELYGYSPGFVGDGYKCADQLVKAHPDKFELASKPKSGAVFSSIGKNHVGIVISVNGDMLTIQEGNLDGKTNTFQDAKSDWHTKKLTLDELSRRNQGVIFANPK